MWQLSPLRVILGQYNPRGLCRIYVAPESYARLCSLCGPQFPLVIPARSHVDDSPGGDKGRMTPLEVTKAG